MKNFEKFGSVSRMPREENPDEKDFIPSKKIEDANETLREKNEEIKELNDTFIEEWGLKETFDEFADIPGFKEKELKILEILKNFKDGKIEPNENDPSIDPIAWRKEMKNTLKNKIKKEFTELQEAA